MANKTRNKQVVDKRTNRTKRFQEGTSSSKGNFSDEIKAKNACKNTDNDPSWYGKSAQLLKDAASITTSNVSGYPLQLADYGNTTYDARSTIVPGIFTLVTHPSVGDYGIQSGSGLLPNPTAAVNLAAKNVYSFVRHANSGASNYDAPDLMCAILAADQVFSAIAAGIRAYGIAMNYDQKNRYTPIGLLTAMGFDPDSVINNLAQFRYYINNLIARASVIWVPDDMSIVARHFWLYSNVYRDSEDSKAQYYMFVPGSFWKFESTAETTGSSLSVVNWGNDTKHTIEDWYKMVTSMLDPIISDEDLGIMFGDMLKAYQSHIFKLDQIPDNYTIMPTHNKEVMYQIHNANAIGLSGTKVVQNDKGVLFNALGTVPRTMTPAPNYIMNFWEESPTPETVMVASRLKARINASDFTSEGYNAGAFCGTEFVEKYNVFYYYAGSADMGKATLTTFTNKDSVGPEITSLISKFDWAPAILIYEYTQGAKPMNDKFNVIGLLMDLDNYTITSRSVLDKMDTTALFSEFGVPKVI
jgi:hypothetical protein